MILLMLTGCIILVLYITKFKKPEVVTQYESWTKTVYVDQPTLVYSELIVWDTLEIDTVAILNDYFTKKVYKDTVTFDKIGSIALDITLFKNGIDTLRLDFTSFAPKVQKNMVGIGFGNTGPEAIYLRRAYKNVWIYGRIGASSSAGVAYTF